MVENITQKQLELEKQRLVELQKQLKAIAQLNDAQKEELKNIDKAIKANDKRLGQAKKKAEYQKIENKEFESFAKKFRGLSQDVQNQLKGTSSSAAVYLSLGKNIAKEKAIQAKYSELAASGDSKAAQKAQEFLEKSQERESVFSDITTEAANQAKATQKAEDALKGISDVERQILNIKNSQNLYSAVHKKQLIDQLQATEDLRLKEERLKTIKEEQQRLFEALPESVKGAVGFAKKLGGALKNGALPMVLLASLALAAFKSFTDLDESAKEFRDTTGLTNSQMKGIKSDANEIVGQFGYMGVGTKEVFDTVAALKSEFSDTAQFSKDTVAALTLMNTNFGISADSAAKVQGIFEQVGGLSEETAASVGMQVANMAKFAGVAPSKVFADIAESAEITSTLFKGDINALAKSAVEARRLGTNIKSVAATVEKLLDFESSIEDELVAATFVSGQFNLSRARALAFEGKIVESQQEILAQVQRTGDFRKKDYYTQQQLAKAAGMTVEEINKQLAVQDRLSTLSGKELKIAKEAIEKGLDISKIDKDQLKTQIKAFSLQQEQQATLDQIKNQFMGIAASIGSSLVPILEMIVPIIMGIAGGLKIVGEILSSVFKLFTGFKESTGDTGVKMLEIVSAITIAGVGIAYLVKGFIAIKSTMASILAFQNSGLAIQKLKTFFTGKELSFAERRALVEQRVVASGKPKIPSTKAPNTEGIKSISKIKMNDVLKGAAAILILSAAMFVAAKAFKEFEDVDWPQVGLGIGSIALLALTTKLLGNTTPAILNGAIAVATLGASLIPFAFALRLLSPFLTAFGTVIESFGNVLVNVLKEISPILIGFGSIIQIVGKSLVDVLKEISPILTAFGTVIESFGNVLVNVLKEIPPIVNSVADGIVKLLDSITLEKALGMFVFAGALGSVGIALAAFAAGMGIAAIAAKFGGGSIIESISKLGDTSDKIPNLNKELDILKIILSDLENYIIPIDRLSESLNNLVSSMFKLGAVSIITTPIMGLLSKLSLNDTSINTQDLSDFKLILADLENYINPIDRLSESLNNLVSSTSIANLSDFKLILADLENYINPIDRLSESLNNLVSSMFKLGTTSIIATPILGLLSKLSLNDTTIKPATVASEQIISTSNLNPLTKEVVKIDTETNKPEQIISVPLNVLVNEIKLLRQDMANGKIAVYMDTEKVTSKISKQVDISTRNVFNLGSV
jgi:hypothetical protein